MGYIIIGVHGLAPKPPQEILTNGWEKAICEGIENLHRLPQGETQIKFEMIDWIDYYRDERDSDPQNQYRRAENEIRRYDDGWLDAMRGRVGDLVDEPLEWLKQRGLVTDAANKVLELHVKDLDRYYKEPERRDKARNLVAEAIKNHAHQRIMLIGHSMGSIITYDVLRLLDRENPQQRIHHYITIGSPLGFPHIQHKIRQEFGTVITPDGIDKWSNFADKLDPVALDSHLRWDFKPNTQDVRPEDDLVLNDWGGINHKSYGYLRCPEVAEQIDQFVKGTVS